MGSKAYARVELASRFEQRVVGGLKGIGCRSVGEWFESYIRGSSSNPTCAASKRPGSPDSSPGGSAARLVAGASLPPTSRSLGDISRLLLAASPLALRGSPSGRASHAPSGAIGVAQTTKLHASESPLPVPPSTAQHRGLRPPQPPHSTPSLCSVVPFVPRTRTPPRGRRGARRQPTSTCGRCRTEHQ